MNHAVLDQEPLQALRRRVRWELETLHYPARPWVRPWPGGHQVIIIGAGQTGLAVAFALKRLMVEDVVILDALPEDRSAVWTGFARMRTLRTPKHVLGPELGVPSLSARAWFEARFGEAAWASLARIPREAWQDYLDWLRDTLALPVRHGCAVTSIRPESEGFTVRAGETVWRARHVVLATGMDGMGAWRAPAAIEPLPRHLWAHSAEGIDFTALRGRRVAVIGAGAGAFDNAGMALEAGAARVDMLVRRPALPRSNPNRWMEFSGFLDHFSDLPDATRWRIIRHVIARNQPPPQDSFSRCAAHANFHLHLGAPVLAARPGLLETPAGPVETDFIIAATGISIDPMARPELAAIAPHIARWRDRYTPPAAEADESLGAYPYLDGNFALTGDAPWLSRIHTAGLAAFPSTGSTGGISFLGSTARRIAGGIAKSIFLHHADAHEVDLRAYDEPELTDLRLASQGERR